jgi:hypothetical protein
MINLHNVIELILMVTIDSKIVLKLIVTLHNMINMLRMEQQSRTYLVLGEAPGAVEAIGLVTTGIGALAKLC